MASPGVTVRSSLHAPAAWIDGTWHGNVRLDIDADGRWAGVTPDAPIASDAERLPGPVLPGLVDAHSHAFQRAFAGHAEYVSGDTHDDFWSWRDRMYAIANRISPDDLREIATRLYVDLLRGGYTHVCEFHYLHHAPDGSRYGDPLAMSRALVDAARATGIGLTLLPVLYERAGFNTSTLRDDQRRFATTVDDVIALRDGVRALRAPNVDAGIAIHSLRAVRPESLEAIVGRIGDDPAPIHIHVSEQVAEVEQSLAYLRMRPVEWLASHVALDRRWQLVHATHVTRDEIDAVAASGAGVVLCPSTEANLGDGITDLPHWLAAGVPLSIGTDSEVTLDWREELRLLEYGQRLALRRRNVAADATQSTATRLFARALAGGGLAAGFDRWGFVAGARADLVVLDATDADYERLLDVMVFTSPPRPYRGVMVAGNWVERR